MSNCILNQSLIKTIPVFDHILIEKEWHRFIEGKPVNTNIVPHIIAESWKRSKEINVNPFDLQKVFLKNDSKSEKLANYNRLISTYGKSLEEIRQLVTEKGFTFVFFDKEGKTNQVDDVAKHIQYKLDYDDIAGFDVSENIYGTNAVFLSLLKRKPIKFLGVYHYNKYPYKRPNAVATPVFNRKGELLGAFSILVNDYKRLDEAFMLVISLAKLFEAEISLMSMEKDIRIHEVIIRNIIETLPQGIMYVDKDNVIKYHNDRILDILNGTKSENVEAELTKYLTAIDSDNLSNDESILLDIKGIKSPVLASFKRIINYDYNMNDKIIFLEERKNELRTNQKTIEKKAMYTFEDIVGKNEKVIEAKTIAKKVAKTSVPVLILGETGTGKELFAQAIHNASLRKDSPFIAINCGAIPSELVESELFGYEEGSFTGALKGGKKGQIEVASEGTLFLDEIESMSLSVQIKLLRTLSTNKILKVGGIKEIPVDVRIISATKKNLLKEADDDRFRADLYYRISTFTIQLPALRDRINDIPILSKYFINKLSQKYGLLDMKISEEFLIALSYYYWGGNIRELANVIERAIVLIDNNRELTVNELPDKIVEAYRYKNIKEKFYSNEKIKKSSKDLLKIGEEIIIELTLRKTNCCLSKTSKILGISRKTLYNKIHESEKLTRVKNSLNL